MDVRNLILQYKEAFYNEGFHLYCMPQGSGDAGIVDFNRRTVYFEDGLSEELFLATMAHEFWHVLQNKYGYDWMYMSRENWHTVNQNLFHDKARVVQGWINFRSVKLQYDTADWSFERAAYVAELFPEEVLDLYEEILDLTEENMIA